MESRRIGVIGTGKMGEALIKGILDSGLTSPGNIIASDVDATKLRFLKNELGINIVEDNRLVLDSSDIVILAVKPQVIGGVLQGIKPHVREGHLLISIAAGVSVNSIRAHLDSPGARIVRVMPNIAVTSGAAVTAICTGAGEDDIETARRIFEAVGRVVVLPEEMMDAITGLSGSGPAFVFLVIEALADAGVYEGLSRETALLLAAQTVFGSAKMVLDTHLHPSLLRDMVTSPAGTTTRGLEVLEERGVRAAFLEAVKAASTRSRELGR